MLLPTENGEQILLGSWKWGRAILKHLPLGFKAKVSYVQFLKHETNAFYRPVYVLRTIVAGKQQ
jgi:hypothetical protein